MPNEKENDQENGNQKTGRRRTSRSAEPKPQAPAEPKNQASAKPEPQAPAKSEPQAPTEPKTQAPSPEPTKPDSAPPPAQPQPQAPQAELLGGVMGAANSTVRIVQKAVSVLEEELAAGISSTQKLEKKMVDVDKLRSGDPQEVIQRFRRDAHDVVDILLDLVNVATNSLDQLTQRVIRIGVSASQTGASPSSTGEGGSAAAGGIPSLAVSTPVKAGAAVEIPMTLENESSKPTDVFYLLSSDLVNPNGDRIAAGQVSFVPEKMVIEPQKSAVITVTVHVPDSTPPGTYSGLLQATKLEQLRAVLSIQIE